MWNIVQDTENYNTHNSDLSSFNRIEWSRPMGFDDAVETIKRHADDKEGAAEGWHPL